MDQSGLFKLKKISNKDGRHTWEKGRGRGKMQKDRTEEESRTRIKADSRIN